MATYTIQRPENRSPWSGFLNEFMRDMNPALQSRSLGSQDVRGVYPPVNLQETDEGYLLTAEIPGISPENLDVSIEGSTVTLSGERKVEFEAGNGTSVHRRERQSGNFRRGFELPSEIDLDLAKATHKNGVLTLRLPKSATSKPRQIAIETR
ncbi:MAG: Hsp20/alpha crystallin family protein [Myxococcales bacterium]|nr:Hsp20/alpha crystallin family protein [Myxococcales bacterium]HIK86286.1 Hsp20/alpha crystallin family protein [Myxococcales bacterium]